MLESDRARAAEIETQISHLEHTLAQLRLEQSQVQERLDSYNYPVLTLPNELVSEIFIRFLPPYPGFPPLIGSYSPTLLTQICRRWREIAVDTPALWSTISSFYDDCDQEWNADIIHLWLERSRGCPLYLIRESETWNNNHFLEIMVPHRARWEYLKINLEQEELPIFDAPMPLLRHLDLTTPEPAHPIPLPPITMGAAPLLRTAILDDHCAELLVILPWAQLTSIALIGVYPSKFVPILTQTTKLVHCELDMYFGNSDDLEFQQDIVLNCLESLDLRCIGGVAYAEFLPTFVVPALRSLKVQEPYFAPNHIDSLKAFISTSGCKLDELHITRAKSVPNASYRQAFPSLRKLSVNGKMIHREDSMSSGSSDS
ncbi:hypothetical protein DFH06DRAFT_709750 [Mycena polygramma]|nr:hypothetical protein DFH06DRAFT_709750 [Mycena polygramma]